MDKRGLTAVVIVVIIVAIVLGIGIVNTSLNKFQGEAGFAPRPGGQIEPVDECQDDADCPMGEICVDHLCVPGCHSDADCPLLMHCLYNECVECINNNDCTNPNSPFCNPLYHNCVECLNNGNCGPGEICSFNQCSQFCTYSYECPAGELCVNNQCHTYLCNNNDMDCPGGYICDSGQCVPSCMALTHPDVIQNPCTACVAECICQFEIEFISPLQFSLCLTDCAQNNPICYNEPPDLVN